MTQVTRRRGAPLVALGSVLACWVAARAAILALPGVDGRQAAIPAFSAATEHPTLSFPPAIRPPAMLRDVAAQGFTKQAATAQAAGFARNPLPSERFALRLTPPTKIASVVASSTLFTARPLNAQAVAPIAPPPSPNRPFATIAGHQLLYAAAFAQVPLPAGLLASAPRPPKQAARLRWSTDGWLLLRPDYAGAGTRVGPYPVYGGSQAGAVLRYRLAPSSARQPLAYLRLTSAIDPVREQEAALGLSVRPLARMPLRAAAELRATQRAGGSRLRPAAFVVTELSPFRLPHGFRAEAYGQAGVVGGGEATAFVDAQVRLDRRLGSIGRAELRGGGGAWGGAQDGAGRIDIGPGVTLGLPLGAANARLSADWRFRIAGQAAPASGPAITLSAGF